MFTPERVRGKIKGKHTTTACPSPLCIESPLTYPSKHYIIGAGRVDISYPVVGWLSINKSNLRVKTTPRNKSNDNEKYEEEEEG